MRGVCCELLAEDFLFDFCDMLILELGLCNDYCKDELKNGGLSR